MLLSEFRAEADDAQRAAFVDTLVGPEVQRARELQAQAIASETAPRLELDPAEWWTVNSAEIELLRRVEEQLGAAAVDASRADETAARTRAGLDAAAVLLVLALAIGLSLVVVRSLLRPLGLLRSSAEEVAHSQLPGVVERLQRAEPVDLMAETQPIGIHDRDEIGQVARAFDAVHSTAVRVAAEQAALRRSVADMFLSLGRRLQALVHRQLELLDELERTEADPQQLRSLFRLDHLATRMRRNAENLLVLSGSEPVRRWSEPVPLPRVIRAASAEIEDYNRVGVMPMADVRVVGHAVSDVVHLLAELIENAAAFSPPGPGSRCRASRPAAATCSRSRTRASACPTRSWSWPTGSWPSRPRSTWPAPSGSASTWSAAWPPATGSRCGCAAPGSAGWRRWCCCPRACSGGRRPTWSRPGGPGPGSRRSSRPRQAPGSPGGCPERSAGARGAPAGRPGPWW